MSVETDSNTDEPVQIYVQLLNEGTTVYRPALATPMGASTFRIEVPEDYDGDVETWEFAPGSLVRCEYRQLQSGPPVRVATSKASS